MKQVSDHQKESHAHANNILSDVQNQHGNIDEKSADLTQKMNERQRNNVEALINSINDDLAANKNEVDNLKLQIKDVDSSYSTLTS